MARMDRPELSRLLIALAVSLTLHLGSYGVYEGGKALHLWDRIHMPVWLQKLTQALTPTKAIDVAKQPEKREPPLMFVEVNPNTPAAEAPKNAKYYAAQNSRAANPDASPETGVPKISGEQDKMMRTEDSERPKPQPLQPALPPPEPAVEEFKPKATLREGDLTLAKADDTTRKGEGEATKPRPRTLAEARAQLAQQSPLKTAGQRAKQDGGVRRRNITSSLDAIGSPFGVYDAAIVAAIQNRWYDLLEERSYASDRTGKVVLVFKLHYDGRITDMTVVKEETTVDELLTLLC